MNCTKCGSIIPQDSKFCPICGSSISAPVSAPAPGPVYGAVPTNTPPTAPNPGPFFTPAPPNTPPAAPNPGFAPDRPPMAPNGMPNQPPIAPAAPAPKKKFPLKLVLFIGGGILLVLALLIIFAIIFKPTTPGEAAINLLEEGNFTIEGKAYGEKATMQVNIDHKNQDITVYAEEGGEFSFAIYDGYRVEAQYNYWSGTTYYVASDYTDEIEEFFESYETLKNSEDMSDDELIELMEDAFGKDMEDYFDMDTFVDCYGDYMDNLSSDSWLKENAGYKTEDEDDMKLHIYEPDLYKFLTATIETFKSSFEYEEDYEEIMEELRDSRNEMWQADLRFVLGVDDGYLVLFEFEIESDYNSQSISFEFTDIGKTKIDMDELEDILDEAEIY